MVNFIKDKIPHVGLDNDRTEIEHFGSKPRYIIAYVLDLGYVQVDNTFAKYARLTSLAQALIGKDKNRKIPTDPVIKKQQPTEGEAAERNVEPHQFTWPEQYWQASDHKRYQQQVETLTHGNDVAPEYEDNLFVIMLAVKLVHASIVPRKHF